MNSTGYERISLLLYGDEGSGFEIGQHGRLVSLYQENIGRPVTGTWTRRDEATYRSYAEKQNWKLIDEVIENWAPSFWDVGVHKSDLDMVLDLEL